ncbi:hypothetical protein DEO72_LG10g1853 [Vigna unguiculata]|uniref:Uncharacterized protein n=1 Tax=Vigna unguiculata TaxID=3917 RepID=A0A4D6NCI6_VIGUN|nr:hypothetical protein DEO72_LG10g1853 [Vigna unguiculata]
MATAPRSCRQRHHRRYQLPLGTSTSRTKNVRPLLPLFSSVARAASAAAPRTTVDNIDRLPSFLSDHRDQDCHRTVVAVNRGHRWRYKFGSLFLHINMVEP